MKALTLWQPWAWALFHGKPVENRTWRLPAKLLGERIAIHGGKTYDVSGDLACRDLLDLDALPELAHATGVIGTLVFDRVIGETVQASIDVVLEPLLVSPWFFGPYGFVHRDAVELRQPVPCRGAMGLWALPPDVEAAVMEQIL